MTETDGNSDRPTVLVLGVNAGQADLIRHMRDRAWHVVSCAHRGDLPGVQLSHRFELIDVTDIDAVAALARRVNARLVYSISSDIAITSAVKVSEKLDLPHFFNSSTVAMFNQKHLLRDYLNGNGLSEVSFRQVDDAAAASD